tara:strand:- start:75 stop:290 length:216 start_codon:yes stop_codon:yes gene_type:complete
VEDSGQKFGNIFIGMLMMFFVMAMIMLFTGCEVTLKTEEADIQTDSTEVQEDSVVTTDYFNAEDWIMFSPF